MIQKAVLLLSLIFSKLLMAEPWVDTRDIWLRADIETLAEIGVIRVPINTYPLMWAGIVKDMDLTPIGRVPDEYKSTYWRVKRAAKRALSDKPIHSLTLSGANSEQVIRQYGDNSRGKAEVSARKAGLSGNFAWNIEVSRVYEPQDQQETRYDHSYLAAILGNWVVSAGYVEKWWGPSWQSANLLSNNARPLPGIMIQRNYSDPAESIFLSWLGHWAVNAFVSELDDPRTVLNSTLSGISFTFRPHRSVEIGLRSTAISGGDGRNDSFTSLLDNWFANGNCDETDLLNPLNNCGEYYTDSGNRLAGYDVKISNPFGAPVSFYASSYGESESELLPSKAITQFGLTGNFTAFDGHWKWYAETSNTVLDDAEYNLAYENEIYQTGYRYYQGAIGSTFDNDSEINTLGLIGNLNRYNQIQLVFSDISLNLDGDPLSTTDKHSISPFGSQFKKARFQWQYTTYGSGVIKVTLDYFDQPFDQLQRQDSEYRVGVEWSNEI